MRIVAFLLLMGFEKGSMAAEFQNVVEIEAQNTELSGECRENCHF
jgi:hypothetical protein